MTGGRAGGKCKRASKR